jgi:hypothetical protein
LHIATHRPLPSALEALKRQSSMVDEKVQEEEASLRLLALQDMFAGNPKIFTPNRRLIKEGELIKVREAHGQITQKRYYAHLFNDALVYSSLQAVGNFTYKMHKAIDLAGASVANSASAALSDTFVVTANTDAQSGMGVTVEKVDNFRTFAFERLKDTKTFVTKVIYI